MQTTAPLPALSRRLRLAAFAAALAAPLWIAGAAAPVKAQDQTQAQVQETQQPSNDAAEAFSPEERLRLESLVRDYILENPEVIVESIRRMEERRVAEKRARSREAVAERSEDLFDAPQTPTLGPADAPVTLVEFFDYRCGYCKRMFPDMMKLAESRDDLRIVFMELPIIQGRMSRVASRAALAAQRQDAYLPLHRALMTMRGKLTENRLFDAARGIGLDVETLKQDMQDPEIEAQIEANTRLAQAIGVTGTPALVTSGSHTLIPGAIGYDDLVGLVESAREAAEAPVDDDRDGG